MIITRVPNFHLFSFYLNQTYDKTSIYFIYIWPSCLKMTGVPYSVSGAHAWLFQFDLHFH